MESGLNRAGAPKMNKISLTLFPSRWYLTQILLESVSRVDVCFRRSHYVSEWFSARGRVFVCSRRKLQTRFRLRQTLLAFRPRSETDARTKTLRICTWTIWQQLRSESSLGCGRALLSNLSSRTPQIWAVDFPTLVGASVPFANCILSQLTWQMMKFVNCREAWSKFLSPANIKRRAEWLKSRDENCSHFRIEILLRKLWWRN